MRTVVSTLLVTVVLSMLSGCGDSDEYATYRGFARQLRIEPQREAVVDDEAAAICEQMSRSGAEREQMITDLPSMPAKYEAMLRAYCPENFEGVKFLGGREGCLVWKGIRICRR